MTRSEFIKWLNEETTYFNDSLTLDEYWKNEVDYVNYIYDEVEVKENTVIFKWERMNWGGSEIEKNEFTFVDFVDRYKNYNLKY